MHVLFITYHLPTDDEPGAFRPWMEARLLRESGYEVTVITSAVHYMTGKPIGAGRGWCREEERAGIRILRVWTVADYRRSLFRRLLNYLMFAMLAVLAALLRVRGRVDCILAATDPILATPFVLMLAAVKRVGTVLDERDLFPDTAIALGVVRKGLLTRWLHGMQQIFRGRAAALLAATPGIKRRLITYGNDHARIQVLRNADPYLGLAPLPPLPARVRELRARYRHLVCYAGTFGKADDVETILRAAARLKDRGDLMFLLLGGGERFGEYVELARGLALDNVIFLGALPRTATRAILAECDLCLQALPPDPFFRSTLTSKTFDYLGVGTPVIFAGEGDTAELLRESAAGLVVAPADAGQMAAAVAHLADHDDLRAAMARAGQRWYTRHVSLAGCREIVRGAIAQACPAREVH